MPIMVKIRDNLSCPVVLCDHCGQMIEQAKHGNTEWVPPEDGSTAELFFTHKWCSRLFRHTRPAVICSGELIWFPVYLVRNLEMDFAEAEERTDEISRLLG